MRHLKPARWVCEESQASVMRGYVGVISTTLVFLNVKENGEGMTQGVNIQLS